MTAESRAYRAFNAALDVGRKAAKSTPDVGYLFTTGMEAGMIIARQHPELARELMAFVDPIGRVDHADAVLRGRDAAVAKIVDA